MHRAHRLLLLGIALSCLALVSPAWGEERIALVIGNGAYDSGVLANPVSDAQLLRDTLHGEGFAVTYLANADRSQMARAIQALGDQLNQGGHHGVGLFYFSGHGVQSRDGHNYLLPVKAHIAKDADLYAEAVDAEWVLRQMEQAGNDLDIVILDACRNSPLPASARSDTRGLANMVAPPHSVLAFATRSGTVAYDGQGAQNSPYASALAYYLRQPGLEMQGMFKAVSQRVYDATKMEAVPQIPVQTYTLAPDFYFRPAATAAQVRPTSPALAPVTSAQVRPVAGAVFRDCTDCPEMVWIAPGHFQMGSPDGHGFSDEHPQHLVNVSAFALGKYDVTFEEWDACVAARGCSTNPSDHGWGRARRPVINVSWSDVQEYVHWLTRKTGHTYRLPSEAEWEYAARAGSTSDWYWGTELGNGHCAGCGSRYDNKETAPVGSFPANPWGLYDMVGNVWQVTQDRFHTDYMGGPADGGAWEDGDRPRVQRGGAWNMSAYPIAFRSPYRDRNGGVANEMAGFRAAMTP
jgi:formylglycine-generating enzyme required for sulfatase activity